MGLWRRARDSNPRSRFSDLHDFQSCSFDQLGQLSISQQSIFYTIFSKKSRLILNILKILFTYLKALGNYCAPKGFVNWNQSSTISSDKRISLEDEAAEILNVPGSTTHSYA